MCNPFSVVSGAADARAPRDGDDDGNSLGEPVEFESVVGAELMLQSRAGGRHADALLQSSHRIFREADPVIAHLQPQHVVVAAGTDGDVTGA